MNWLYKILKKNLNFKKNVGLKLSSQFILSFFFIYDHRRTSYIAKFVKFILSDPNQSKKN